MFKKITLLLALVATFCLNASAAKVDYSVSFTSGPGADWTTLDVNADGVTYTFDNSMGDAAMSINSASAYDDYYVSPAFQLEAGVTYTVKAASANPWSVCGGNLSLVYGQSATDATAFQSISALSPVDEATYANVTPQEFEVIPSATGTYHFAFYTEGAGAYLSHYVISFSIAGGEEGGEGFAYAAEFSAGSDDAWTVVDNNADGVKYIYDTTMGAEEAAMCVNTGGATASIDDYYVSPAFNLNAGVAYSIKALVANLYGSCSGNVSLVAGAADAELSSYETIGKLTCAVVYSLADAVAEEFTFTPTADGKYKFAFYTSGQSSYLTPYVKGFSIEGASGSLATDEEPEQPVEPEEPGEVGGPFTITENFDDDSHFTTSTTVPDGWSFVGSFPFQRGIATDYGFLANSGSYIIASARQQYDTSVDEVIYTPLKKLVAGKECKLSFYVYAPGGSPVATFYQTVTVKAGTAQTADAQTIEVGAITAAVSSWTKYEYAFTPEADGEYCFSLVIARSTALNRDHGLLLFDDFEITGVAPEAGEEPEEPEVVPVELPYAIDFTTASTDDVAAWTALDLTEEGYSTWKYQQYGYSHSSNPAPGYLPSIELNSSAEVQNDYWVSPAFNLEAGKKYVVKSQTSAMNTSLPATWTLELGKDAADAATFASVGTLSPCMDYVAYTNIPTKETTIEVAESGFYYLAVHVVTESTQSSSNNFDVHSFAIEEKPEVVEPEAEPVALPYSIDFTAAANTEWTTIDSNGSLTWSYVADGFNMEKPAVSISAGYGVMEESDDYYVSPAFNLEAGKTYKVSTRVADGFNLSGGTLNLQIGTSVNNASTYSVVTDLSPVYSWDYANAADVPAIETEVTVEEDGVYHFAIYQNVAANVGWLYSLIDFAIEEYVEGGEEPEPEPEPVVAELPYEIDFTATQEGWNAVDKSETPGTTWAVATGTAMGGSYTTVKVATDFNSATDDYYVSPAFNFEEGAKYKVSVKAFDPVWSGTHAEFSILYGNSADNVTAYSTIAEKIAVDYNTYDYTGNGASKLPVIEYEFTSEFTGQCCVALHVASLVGVQNTEIFTFAIQKTADAPQPDPLYAFGAFNGWDPLNSVEFTYVDGVYVLENIELAGDKNFGLATIQTSDWNALASYRYGFKQDNAVATEGEAMAIVQGTGAIKAPATGVYNIVVDMSAMTVTLNWVDYLPKLYVFGNVGTSHWSTTEGVALAHIGEGVYKGVVDVAGAGEFTFVTVRGASWNDVNKDVRYGSLSAGQQLSVDETTDAEVSMTNDKWGSTTNWKLAAGTYTMTVDIVNCTLKVELGDKVGVENVVVDVVEPIYFNLQGVQVANPEAGNLYIVVRGNKVSKEIKF